MYNLTLAKILEITVTNDKLSFCSVISYKLISCYLRNVMLYQLDLQCHCSDLATLQTEVKRMNIYHSS